MDTNSLGQSGSTASAPTHAPATTDTPKHKWTIMAYLAGDNNLSMEMIWSLKEIFRVGAPSDVAVTVQFDPAAESAGTRFYALGDKTTDFDGRFLVFPSRDLGESDTGDVDTIADFVARSVESATATNYMLILSGHGGGIVGDFLTDSNAKRLSQPGSLTIPDMRQLFPRIRQRLNALDEKHLRDRRARGVDTVIDVLGMDSCLMSMGEICSEVSGEVGFLVGSEGFVPNTGWPYYRLLQRLRNRVERGKPLPEPKELIETLVDNFTAYYSDFSDAKVSVDLSACDVSEKCVNDVHDAVREFVSCYERHRSGEWFRGALVLAHWRAQSYKWEHYTDLADFAELLVKECEIREEAASDKYKVLYEDVRRCAQKVATAIHTAVKVNDYSGPRFQYSRGLSVYFPWSRDSYSEGYRSTKFAILTGWDKFLDGYLDDTQRRPRDRATDKVKLPETTDPETVRVLVPSRAVGTNGNGGGFAGLALGHRATAPADKATAPADKATAPADRVLSPAMLALQLVEKFDTLPSVMKNMPVVADSIVRLNKREDKLLIENLRRDVQYSVQT